MAKLWFEDSSDKGIVNEIDLAKPETYRGVFNPLVTVDYSDPKKGYEIRGIRPPISNNEQQTKNKT